MGSGSRNTIRQLIAHREADWRELERVAKEIINDPVAEPAGRSWAVRSLASAQGARGQVGEAFRTLRESHRIAMEGEIHWNRREPGRLLLIVASKSPSDGYALDGQTSGASEWDRVWQGLAAVEAGDTALAQSELASLPEPELSPFGRPRALDALIRVLEARLAAKNGDWAGALSQLEAVTGDRAPVVSDFFDEQPRNQLAHWALAEVQEHLGELEVAASTFAGVASGEQFGYSDTWNLGLTYSFARRRAALLYGQVGNREKAVEHWRAFLDAFTQPDPELEWMVEEAREELGRLGG